MVYCLTYCIAEICEFAGPFILHILSTKYGRNHNGIYRAGGLACFENTGGPKADQKKKKLFIKRINFALNKPDFFNINTRNK